MHKHLSTLLVAPSLLLLLSSPAGADTIAFGGVQGFNPSPLILPEATIT